MVVRGSVCAAIILLTAPVTAPVAAQGFNPFGDLHTTTGAYGTRRTRPAAVAPPSSQSAVRGTPRRGATVASFLGDDEDEPAQQPRSLTRAPGPAYPTEGGPQPAISGTTPPLVAFRSGYGAGNVVIDSGGRALYYVVSSTQAYKYPVAVGREGFSWTGVERVSRKASWPEWRPPAEMRERQPGLPEVMSGGIRNPLGARAIYLGSTLYRIHGTNDTRSIGSASSSGCFRMANTHVVDLFNRVSGGATVHVVQRLPASISGGLAEADEPPAAQPAARARRS
jgi:lipoprotein-anchoring transpeptidase ErfK/SrfK